MFIMQVVASQLHFLANKNAELAISPLFWPLNCIKIGGHVALLSDSTVYSLYCGEMSLSQSQISLRRTDPVPYQYNTDITINYIRTSDLARVPVPENPVF